MPEPEVTNPAVLDRCPDCGYLLAGLPIEGLCPECGFSYDSNMIVLYGWRDKAPRSLWFSLLSGIVLAGGVGWWLSSLTLWVFHLPALGLGQFEPILQLFLVALAVALAVISVIQQHRGPPPIQVRFTPAGLGQRDGFGKMKLTPWDPRIRIDTRLVTRRFCQITAHYTGFVPDKVNSTIIRVCVPDGISAAALALQRHLVHDATS